MEEQSHKGAIRFDSVSWLSLGDLAIVSSLLAYLITHHQAMCLSVIDLVTEKQQGGKSLIS